MRQARGIRERLFVLALVLCAPVPAATAAGAQEPSEQTPTGAPETVIRAQLAAYNAHDVEAMVANVAAGFVYFAVDSDSTEPQLRGREAFHQSMTRYFRSVSGTRAEIEEMFRAGEFIAVRERAYWMESGRERSQVSLAVYEIRDGLIYRVWYYPAAP